jgi:hypothetical protein
MLYLMMTETEGKAQDIKEWTCPQKLVFLDKLLILQVERLAKAKQVTFIHPFLIVSLY